MVSLISGALIGSFKRSSSVIEEMGATAVGGARGLQLGSGLI